MFTYLSSLTTVTLLSVLVARVLAAVFCDSCQIVFFSSFPSLFGRATRNNSSRWRWRDEGLVLWLYCLVLWLYCLVCSCDCLLVFLPYLGSCLIRRALSCSRTRLTKWLQKPSLARDNVCLDPPLSVCPWLYLSVFLSFYLCNCNLSLHVSCDGFALSASIVLCLVLFRLVLSCFLLSCFIFFVLSCLFCLVYCASSFFHACLVLLCLISLLKSPTSIDSGLSFPKRTATSGGDISPTYTTSTTHPSGYSPLSARLTDLHNFMLNQVVEPMIVVVLFLPWPWPWPFSWSWSLSWYILHEEF